MNDEPRIHVGLTRRFRNDQGMTDDVTVNLSQIPATAGPGLIAQMMLPVRDALDAIEEELACRFGGKRRDLNHAALDEPLPYCLGCGADPCGCAEGPLETREITIDSEETIAEVARQILEPISAEEEVTVGRTVYGVQLQEPPAEWHSEPITVDTGESGKGQLVAVNAALTSAGHGGFARHPAALTILKSYGEIAGQPARDSLGSIKDMTKAEAHIVLSWLEKAAPENLLEMERELKCLL